MNVIDVAIWVGFFSINFTGAGSTIKRGFYSGFLPLNFIVALSPFKGDFIWSDFLIVKFAYGVFNAFVGVGVSVEPITIN